MEEINRQSHKPLLSPQRWAQHQSILPEEREEQDAGKVKLFFLFKKEEATQLK